MVVVFVLLLLLLLLLLLFLVLLCEMAMIMGSDRRDAEHLFFMMGQVSR